MSEALTRWAQVIGGCLLCADAGFLAVRLARTTLAPKVARARRARTSAGPAPLPRAWPPASTPPLATAAPADAARPADTAHAAGPIPTVQRPVIPQLALWADQIKAGQRKMAQTTDGCRVTWDRSCKHGHPTWVVYLGYVTAPTGSSYDTAADSTPR